MRKKLSCFLALTMVLSAVGTTTFTPTVLAETTTVTTESTTKDSNLLSKVDNKEVTPENLGIPGETRYGTQYYARNIWDMTVKDGKVLLSMGDYGTNTGAVPIYYYTNDSKEKKECTYKSPITTEGLSSEEIKRFYNIDGEIYATATDPLGMGQGSYYKYDSKTNQWSDFYKLPLCIHCYDMVEYDGEIFFAGMMRNNKQQIISCVQKLSKDKLGSTSSASNIEFYDLNGKKMGVYTYTYTGVNGVTTAEASNLWRAYDIFVYKGELYAAHSSSSSFTLSERSGLFKYDKKNNRFNQIDTGNVIKGFMSVTRNTSSYVWKIVNGKSVQTPVHYTFEKNERIYETLKVGKESIYSEPICGAKISTPNVFVAVCNGIFKSKDVKTFEKVSLGAGYENYVTRDAFELDGKYYFLASQMNGTDDFTTAVFETDGNFAKFRKVLSFPTKSFARSFAYNDGMLYVGLGGNGRIDNMGDSNPSKYSGTLYRVDLSNLVEKEDPKPVTYKKLSEVNFKDVANWRTGHYNWTTGKYESYNGRICLTNYVLPESGKIYVVNVPSNYNMLIRELDKDGKFLRSSNLANQATFTPVANCYKLGISIYNPSNSNVSFDTYKNLIKNGTSFSLTLLPPDTSKKISEVNFSEKANWRTGNFDSTTGLYAKFKGRMCLTSYVLPDTGKAYTVNVPSEFCMLIGELDKNGNLLKTTELKNQETFTPVANCYKLGISVYYPDNCHFSFDAYLNLMKKGTIFSLTEKTAAEYTNMDYYQCLGYNKTGYFKDTTVPLNEKCSIEMKVSTTPYQYANLMNTTNTRFRIEYNIGLYMAYSWWNEKNYTPKENEVFVVKEAAGKAYINGKQVRDCTSCKIKFNSTGMEFGKAVCNIYYLKVWDENNKLIRSYIPVKNKDGKPCFYDEVTKKYFYASK